MQSSLERQTYVKMTNIELELVIEAESIFSEILFENLIFT